MSDVIHATVARLRRFIGNRRRVLRHETRLPLSLRLLNNESGGGETAPTLEGNTRDISETGLTFVVPSIHFDDTSVGMADRPLQIVLELPVGPIEIHAAALRYEQHHRLGYLIFARITHMSDVDRTRYTAYLHRLSMKAEGWGM